MKSLFIALQMLLVWQSACGQSGHLTIEDLAPLVGSWRSQVGIEYKDHPMIKRLNPDRKPNLMTFRWGVGKKVMHVSIYNLDRPNPGDTTLFIEGSLMPNPADTTVVMLEFNAESDIFFDGIYSLDASGNVIRTYVVGFTNGSTMKFKERWIWADDKKQAFYWHTSTFKNGKYEEGEIVVTNTKIN